MRWLKGILCRVLLLTLWPCSCCCIAALCACASWLAVTGADAGCGCAVGISPVWLIPCGRMGVAALKVAVPWACAPVPAITVTILVSTIRNTIFNCSRTDTDVQFYFVNKQRRRCSSWQDTFMTIVFRILTLLHSCQLNHPVLPIHLVSRPPWVVLDFEPMFDRISTPLTA